MVEIGNYPAYVVIDSGGVSVQSDHNTDDYDTTLDRHQVLSLYQALGDWLMNDEF